MFSCINFGALMDFGTVMLVALVPCCFLLVEVVFDKILDWIRQQRPQVIETCGTRYEQRDDSDQSSSFSDSSEEDSGVHAIVIDADLAWTTQQPDDDDEGWWMSSPNGNNGRFIKPRNRLKSQRA